MESGEGAILLARALAQNRSITALNLSNNRGGEIKRTVIIELAKVLRQNRSLISLNLSGNQIGATGAVQLARALAQNRSLALLDLGSNDIGSYHDGDPGTTELAKALRQNRTLTSLNLANNNISDLGIIELAEALTQNCTLTSLDLKDSYIRNATAIELFKALRTNRTLTSLNLGDLDLTEDKIIRLVIEALEQNHTLTSLTVVNHSDNYYLYDNAMRQLIQRNQQHVIDLITAIRHGNTSFINDLLTMGVSINQIFGHWLQDLYHNQIPEPWAQDKGSSPMMIACKAADAAVVDALLPYWNNNDIGSKKIILDIIIKRNSQDIIQLFVKFAIAKNDQGIIQLLRITEEQQMQEHLRQGLESYNQGNYREAARHLQPAAKGYADAQYTLGLMHENGQGIQKNETTALELYQKATKQGHISAQKQLDLIQQRLAEKARAEELKQQQTKKVWQRKKATAADTDVNQETQPITSKDIDEQAQQVEVLQRQLEHESKMRIQAQQEAAEARKIAEVIQREAIETKREAERRLAQVEKQMAALMEMYQHGGGAAAAAPRPSAEDSDSDGTNSPPIRQRFGMSK